VPNRRVGLVERWWSPSGSVAEGRVLALNREAGFQAEILRGGLHLGLSPLWSRVHLEPLVTVGQGTIAYVYARDGEALPPTQALGRVVACNDFQDARAFLGNGGQRGRQRGMLREGVYAINLSLFVVLCESRVYTGPADPAERVQIERWHAELAAVEGFRPVVIGNTDRDAIGIVTVHDGPPVEVGEVIAPEPVGDHGCFQNPEAFLACGGRRGKQLQVLTDGTYYLNRWFASVERNSKTVIPIGYVGVVVSYHGVRGTDVTGEDFRYGEQVEPGHRGVWKRALPPGKYALNPSALKVELVPTVNFVLRWVTGETEAHEYDKDLKSLELITADGFEPTLPLSLVLHIDYEDAPRVVQRFGDVKRLISQTLDPILSAYFRDAAQNCQMLDLLTRREELQRRATDELGRRFREFDITCVAAMIGRPESRLTADGTDPIEHLFDQLRVRRISEEKIATYRQQEEAAVQLRSLHRASAEAEKESELAAAEADVRITAQRGDAAVVHSQRAATANVARAEGEAQAKRIEGAGEADAIARVGEAKATVERQRRDALGDSRLVALENVIARLATSDQPLVPSQLVTRGGGHGGGLLAELVARVLAVEPNSTALVSTAAESK
ncbi:MAG: SPFH domain-containing protein, partial [Myxococcota bacterium]